MSGVPASFRGPRDGGVHATVDRVPPYPSSLVEPRRAGVVIDSLTLPLVPAPTRSRL